MPAPLPIQTQINNLNARLTVLDGIGLTGPGVAGQIAQILALIAGLKKTLGNVNMGYKTDVGALNTDFQTFKVLVSAALNI